MRPNYHTTCARFRQDTFEIISNSNAILHGGSLGGVLHQHGTGHGANAAGHRGDVTRHGACFLKVHIAVQLAVRTAVDADIDHHGAGLDHIASHKTSAANGGNQNIRVGADFFQVGRMGMADRNGCILASSNRAAGLPTMLERPMTTAFLPSILVPVDSIMRMQPAGVQGKKQG